MIETSGEDLKALLRELRRRWRWPSAASFAVAFAAHGVLALGVYYAASRARPQESPPIEALTVALVEPPAPEPPAQPPIPAAASPDPDEAAAGADAPTVDFTPSLPSSISLPGLDAGFAGASAPATEIAPAPDAIRLAVASAAPCRLSTPPPQADRSDCSAITDRSARAAQVGITTASLKDPRLAPWDWPAEFEFGPVDVEVTLFGSGSAPFQVTITPRPR
ncbi:MAG: hypothetical protein PVI23_05975 [Maricaulaceae bacterium]